MADVGAVWHLRYRSASASAYKWEVVGASPIGMGVATNESASVATGTFTTVSANSPKLTVPVAGDYFVTNAALVLSDVSANQTVSCRVKINAATPGGASYNVSGFQVPSAEFMSMTGNGRETFAAADALTQVYSQSSGATKTLYRNASSLFITPIRVG